MSGLVFSLLPLLVVFVIVRALTTRGKGAIGGHPVRHFFQYMLMYGLMAVVAAGLGGLLGRVLGRGTTLAGDETALARSLAFCVVGIPVLALMVNWTRRRFATEPAEKDAFGWGLYLAVAGLTSLMVTMASLQEVLRWAVGLDDYSGTTLATALVWGTAWAVHWWLDRVVTPHGQTRLHHVLGSLIGLVWAATGLVLLLAATLRQLMPLSAKAYLLAGDNPMLSGAVTLVVGVPVWFVYWLRTFARAQRDSVWDAYVMVAGVAGGLVTAVISASVLIYDILVWFLGSPGSTDASEYLRNVPASTAAALVGVLVWWYHRAVLAEVAPTGRTEGQRIYEYLVAAIGLVAAAIGLTIMLVALIETVTPQVAMTGSGGPRNTLLAAATLLLVGAPVWWFFWHRLERAVSAEREAECVSPARRFYLFMLFGIGGTAAVIALIVTVYLLFDDIVAGQAGTDTLRGMRYGLAVLVTTAAVSGYHWLVYRGEREVAAAGIKRPRFVLLAGVPDRALGREVAERAGSRVEAWLATGEVDATPWSADAVLAAIAEVDADEVVVVAEAGALRAIPVDRR
jgi:hypothetical protein